MAKAVANATTAAFITMVGSEFVQKYLGEGPRMVRDVFRLARENSPAIIFIDEIGEVFCYVCILLLLFIHAEALTCCRFHRNETFRRTNRG